MVRNSFYLFLLLFVLIFQCNLVNARTFSTQTGVISFSEVGHGETLVLIHAFPLDQRLWQPQLDGLKDKFHVIALDLLGFGRSAVTNGDPISMTDYADEVKELLDYLHIEKAIIGGESMGGYVALAYLAKYPETVTGLILSNTQAITDSEQAKENREELARILLSGNTSKLKNDFLTNALSMYTDPEKREQLIKILDDQSPAGMASALRGMANRYDMRSVLIETEIPVLIISSKNDKVISEEQSQLMHELARNSRLVIINKAGHLTNFEQPDAWNKAVIAAFIPEESE